MAISTTTASTGNAPSPTNSAASPARRGGFQRSKGRPPAERKPQEIVKTWAFDSVGNRKYALQIKKASNGNPCLKIVEGVPQPDGTFRKFDLTVWSEDWPRLFEMLDTVRGFIAEQNIRTPDGHKYDPNKKSKWKKK